MGERQREGEGEGLEAEGTVQSLVGIPAPRTNGVWRVHPEVEVVRSAIKRISNEVGEKPSTGSKTSLGAKVDREEKIVGTKTTVPVVTRGFNAKAKAPAAEIKENPRRLWGLVASNNEHGPWERQSKLDR